MESSLSGPRLVELIPKDGLSLARPRRTFPCHDFSGKTYPGESQDFHGSGWRSRWAPYRGACREKGGCGAAESYLSASDNRVHFGLGEGKTVRLLELAWPSGIVQRLEKVTADQVLRVREPNQ